jgi:hypothetical protein
MPTALRENICKKSKTRIRQRHPLTVPGFKKLIFKKSPAPASHGSLLRTWRRRSWPRVVRL